MKKLFTLSIFLFIQQADLFSQYNFQWAQRGGLYAYDYGYGVTTDNAGDVYVTGKFEMNAVFGSETLICAGNHDAYLAKYSPSGDLKWIKTAGGANGDYAWSVACDGTSLYMSGEIEGYGDMISFTGSTLTIPTVGDNDVFFAKYDLEGKLLWAKGEGGLLSERAMSITYDNSGNILICGHFTDNTKFNGVAIPGYGGKDIFVAKYDKDGNFQWVKTAGSTGRDEAKSVKCDASGNVYICGLISNNCTFGAQTLTTYKNTKYFDSYVAKYDPNGNLLWVKTGGGDYDDVAWSLAIDSQNKIYVTGEFNAYAEFGTQNLTTVGNADIFVGCYDDQGSVQWMKRSGGTLIDRARGIHCNGSNLYITGQFGGSATMGTTNLLAVDSSDIFVAGLNTSGDYQWALSAGGAADPFEELGFESGLAVWGDKSGSVYATGGMLNGAVFGGTGLAPYSRSDMYLTQISTKPVGIAEKGSLAGITFFPNPTSGQFTISMPSVTDNAVKKIRIYDCMGAEVSYQVITESGQQLSVDLTGKAEGVYFLQVETPGTIESHKLFLHH